MSFWSAVLEAGVRLAVPVLLAALGELISERAGVINIGLEGMMAAGAYVAFYVTLRTGSLWFGAIAGILAGLIVAGVMVVLSVRGRADQVLTGFALAVLAPAVVDFLYAHETQAATVSGGAVAPVQVAATISIPILHSIPVVGTGFFTQNGFYYAAVCLAIVVWFTLAHTRFGLEATACGQDPLSAAAKGVRVLRVRTIATLAAGASGGLGGAALTIGALGAYLPGVTGAGAGTVAGRGFVAIAIVILGRWSLGWTVVAAFIYGLSVALQLNLQNIVNFPAELLSTIPWLVVLMMLIVGARSTVVPRALARRIELA